VTRASWLWLAQVLATFALFVLAGAVTIVTLGIVAHSF
jgi:hypothetical protein